MSRDSPSASTPRNLVSCFVVKMLRHVALVKRKKALSREDYRDGWENEHADIVLRFNHEFKILHYSQVRPPP